MGVTNKTVGTNCPSFGQFVPNLEVMKKKLGQIDQNLVNLSQFLGTNCLKLGQLTKVGRIDLKLEQTDQNWYELVWDKLDLERIDLYPYRFDIDLTKIYMFHTPAYIITYMSAHDLMVVRCRSYLSMMPLGLVGADQVTSTVEGLSETTNGGTKPWGQSLQ